MPELDQVDFLEMSRGIGKSLASSLTLHELTQANTNHNAYLRDPAKPFSNPALNIAQAT